MKLIRFGEPGRETPGVALEDSARCDVSSFTRDYDEAFFADGGLEQLEHWLKDNAASAPALRSLSDWDRRFVGPVRSFASD
jgi:2,4-diketo-3-deoxy-L-fuconate hydrolase